MKLRLFQIDAFASRVFAGNPAAVVPLERWLDDATLQGIAAENNLAETAFLVGGQGQYEIRWMAPTVEVDLCGHATLASGWVVMTELIAGYRAAFINPSSKLLGPKFKFARHGGSGAELSELLPYTAKIVDEIAIVKSMVTDAFNHAPAQLLMNTGAQQFGRPSMGAWVSYGLGSEAQDLPTFVAMSTGRKGPSGGNACWGAGFLPTVHAGRPPSRCRTRSLSAMQVATSCAGPTSRTPTSRS